MSDVRRNRYDDDEHRPAVAANYDAYAALAQTQRDLARTVDTLQETVQELALTVRAVQAQMPTQESIQAEIDKRIPRGEYAIAHTALENEMRERSEANRRAIAALNRRVQGTWNRAAPWVAIGVTFLGMGITAAGVCVSLFVGVASIVAAVLLHGSPLP